MRAAVDSVLYRVHQHLHTIIELAVGLLTVDYVESITNSRTHIAHLEIEPLVIVITIDIGVQDQVILKLSDLYSFP